MEFKPQRRAFFLRNTLVVMIFFGILGCGGAVAAPVISSWLPLLIPPVSAALIGVFLYRAKIVYGKENYEIREDRIVVLRGGLFSDAEIELQLEHVTHVKWIRPWLWYKFFGTGILRIEAAGSAESEVFFTDVEHSDQIYRHIRDVMHNRGFSMSTATLKHQEGPAPRGIIVELVLGAFGIIFGIITFVGPLILAAIAAFPPIILLFPVFLGGGIAVLVVHYLDLRRRIYSIFDGVIEYHEGFLTKNDAFIPVENVSNSEIARGVIDRLTQLYQVKVSCQGAGQEIRFRHLEYGPQFDAAIEELIDVQSEALHETETAAAEAESATLSGSAEMHNVGRDTESTARYTMDARRTLIPLLICFLLLPVLVLIFPLLILLVGYTVYQFVRVKNTAYDVEKHSIKETFDFVTSKTREFTTDKITGVTFRESVIDQWFGTCSIKFWSIGAAEEITFRNIVKDDQVEQLVLDKAGIRPSEDVVYNINSEFSVGKMILAELPAVITAILVFFGGAVAGAYVHGGLWALPVLCVMGVVLKYVYGRLYYPRSRVTLFENCLEFNRGLLIRLRTCALYPNVKDITTTKYPFIGNGWMRFNVAGEQIRKSNNGEVRIPYGFTVYYVPDILDKDDIFDQLLLGRTEPGTEPEQPLMKSGKAAANTLFSVIILSVIIFPFIALLPVTLPIAIWRVRLVRYIIEPNRVLMRKGVLYRRQTSIIFDRIDHIQTSQNFLNKLFNNGNITIHTAGSSRPELVLTAIPSWKEFYQELRRHY